ncbi:MAG: TRAM domain-containing protein, partial [Candidatus Thermoplasmatota archaeon]
KKDRMILIRCDACGAFRPVGSLKKKRSTPETETLKEGCVYEVTIKDIGKRGDGVAYVDKYAVYISGAVKGSTVKVKIDKISGNAAFGSIVQ